MAGLRAGYPKCLAVLYTRYNPLVSTTLEYSNGAKFVKKINDCRVCDVGVYFRHKIK
jgi:hypothetical protein